jgi:septal ring-binding cell division protein DamX
MSPRQNKTPKTGKRYRLEFSITSAFFWSLGLFILLGWIFVLGILVGRGLFPGGAKTLSEMKTQIAKLQDIVGRKDSSDQALNHKLSRDPKFRFYDELSAEKGGAPKKGRRDQIKGYDHADLNKRIKALEEIVAKRSQMGTGKTETRTRTDKKVEPLETGEIHTVQLASLGSEKEAIKMVKRLKEKGYPAYFYKTSINGKPYYRVRCGTFRTEKEATDLKSLLAKKEGIKGFATKAGE